MASPHLNRGSPRAVTLVIDLCESGKNIDPPKHWFYQVKSVTLCRDLVRFG
jgi:hypothetical protein